MKRKLASEENLLFFPKRQLRSRMPRRRRSYIPRLLFQFPSVAVDSSDFAGVVTQEVSCESSIASVGNLKPPEKRNELLRDVIHTYRRNRSRQHDQLVDLSENSCVESCHGDSNGELLKLKSTVAIVSGEVICKSEVSSTSPRFDGGSMVVSGNGNENVVGVEGDDVVLDDEITCIDLTCSEVFSFGLSEGDEEEEEEEEEDNPSESFVNVTSDLEVEGSQLTDSSILSSTSGSQFSDKSIGYETTSTFHLLNHFKQHFYRSTFASPICPDDHNSPLLGLENEEDEESYRMLRKRERRQVYLRDYTEEHYNITGHGNQIIRQQRLVMVHWIVEQATNNEFQMETMFLGVGLLDRFLSKGYFKNMMFIEIAGIACLTLATRIEEIQPYNCISEKTEAFSVGRNTYERSEVVAMEWLVMEVLNFQCFLPTTYNFLWYYLKAARANKKMEKTAKYLGVLSLLGHQQLCFWPSIVAAGLVILASTVENEDASYHVNNSIHAREKDNSLPECIKSLEWLMKYL